MSSVEHPIEFDTVEWGRSRIDRSDLELLAGLTAITEAECLDRLRSYRPDELAAAWHKARPTSPEAILNFYAETDLYLWELLGWNGSSQYKPYLDRVDRLSESWPAARFPLALDYGSGVGTAALRLAERGYTVTVADVPGITLTFARERLARRGYEVGVVEITDDCPALPKAAWHVLVSFDVLEHAARPAGLAGRLTGALRRGGGAAIVAAFDMDDPRCPQHLSEGRDRFRGGRWEMFLRGLGMSPEGDFLYRRVTLPEQWARTLRYRFWQATGFYVARIPR